MDTNATNILTSLYGNASSTALTASSTGLSPTVAARVQQALAGQKGNIDKLNADLTRDQTRLSGLGQLQSALDAFEMLAESLSGAGMSTSATSSTTGVLTAATSASAKAGTYKLDVTQLAQGQILNSATQLTADAPLGSGTAATVKIQWGAVGDKGFDPDPKRTATINIDSSNNSLDGIAAELKKAGVDASVVKSNNGYALQIRGKDGATENLSISVTGDAALKAAIGFDPEKPTAGGMKQAQAAQDAILTVDGTRITSASNKVENAVPGTTLTLTGKGATTLTVAHDTSQISKNVAAFVQGYNDLSAKLAALQDGPLKNDQALKQVSTQLEGLMRIGSTGSSAETLANAGLTRDRTGKLVLDQTKLDAAIKADPEGIAKLFTNEGRGMADRLEKKVEALTGQSGLVTRAQAQVTRSLDTLTDRREQLAKSLTVQAQALAQLYTMQEQMGGTGTLLDLLG
ncbi:flagellar hook-associated protein 2 [Pseudoduganella flava]|uniref:Flagellar hook-associated protein 2 n=1 Tax=Pseudoduganella flava TaxID=871742 RepID=A0A562PK76_9BURK|nr:flagellar filament capping protein FliD [Pseudoduganella flava]QGZ42251.1 flagellar filament capping protein FliD [Pseudoduganella flava]TWI44788.1 flagellar hook-associated protein 2 [Pseudoduganella flava]